MKSTISIALYCLTCGGRSQQHLSPRSTRSFDHSNKHYHSSDHTTTSLHALKYNDLEHIVNIARGGGIGSLDLFFRNYPYIAAFMVCASKASMADVVAQKSNFMSMRQKTMDVTAPTSTPPFKLQFKRTIAFLLYGGLYQGCFQEFCYNNIYPRIFGFDTTLPTAIKKVFCESFIIGPTLCIPFAYIVKAIVYRHPIKRGLKEYRHDVMKNQLLIKNLMIWGPVNIMTFTIIPTHFRIAFVAFFSFFWMILLSTISSKSKDLEE